MGLRLHRAALPAALFLALLAACQACEPADADLRAAFAAGDFEAALAEAEALAEEEPSGARVWALQKGVVQLARGRADLAVRDWITARDLTRDYDAYDTGALRTMLSNVSAVVTDDRALPYPIRDYEQLMLYALMTLSEVVSGGGDQVPLAYQGQEKILEAIANYKDARDENPKANYRLVGFGDYVYAAFREEDPTHTKTALRAYERFAELEPNFPFVEEDLARLRGERSRADDAGVLYVFSMVGRGPVIEEAVLDRPAAQIIALLNQLWAFSKRKFTVPIFQNISVPRLGFPEGNPSDVLVTVNGQPAGSTVTVTDINACAQAEFDAMYESIVLRACVRRVVKTVLKEVGKNAVGGDPRVDLAIDVVANIWAAAECPDQRCWSLLPAQAQVLRIELPEGDYEIGLSAAHGALAGPESRVSVHVTRGYHTYLLGLHPDLTSPPRIISSASLLPELPRP